MMIKLMLGLLIIACIAPLFIKGPDGEPLMTLDDWKPALPGSIASLFDRSEDPRPNDTAMPQKLAVYKWQDEDGQWHFANTPPDLVNAEQIEIGEVNLMEAYIPPLEESEAAAPAAVIPAPGMAGTVSSSQIKQMMDTVNNLQGTIDARKTEMDELTGNR